MERDNSQWITHLQALSPQRDAAITDLGALLARGLQHALRSYNGVGQADIDDFVQEALIKVLAGLGTFRGESRFVTWAQKIAVHVAISELRRARWRDVSLVQHTAEGDELEAAVEHAQQAALSGQAEAGPEHQAVQQIALHTLQRALQQELTERQREAITSILLEEMPFDEVARRMGTNRNALYKLLHDARQRLKKSLLSDGTPAQEILAAFESP